MTVMGRLKIWPFFFSRVLSFSVFIPFRYMRILGVGGFDSNRKKCDNLRFIDKAFYTVILDYNLKLPRTDCGH